MTPVADAIYSKLTTDTGAGGINTLSTGGFHNGGVAPQGTARPFVTYQFAAITPEYTFPNEYWRWLRVNFKCYGVQEQGWSLPGQMADRLEAILTNGTLSISGYVLKVMHLRQRLDLAEPEDGILYPITLLDYELAIGAS